MKPVLKALLEASIEFFIERACEEDNWPNEGLACDRLAEYMTDAAETVFDAVFASSAYTINET